MKKFAFILIIFFFCLNGIYAQRTSQIDSLVRIGIKLHDEKKYEEAIDIYKEALKIDSKSPLVNYEIAYSYFESKNYKKAIEFCNKVLKTDNKSVLPAYVVKGSSLDYQNKTDEAIEVFEGAIKKYKSYLLYFNLALVYNRIKNYREAESNLVKAIELKYDHPGSHMQLGYTCSSQNKRVEGLMSLYYFLFLEATTPRAIKAYDAMQNIYANSAKKVSERNIDIVIDSKYLDSEFSAAELLLPMLQAVNLTETEGVEKSEEEKFIDITSSFFISLGEQDSENKSGLWWNFYVPFFYQLAKSDHIDTFCYYISRGVNPKAREWLEQNEEKVDKFAEWFSLNKTTFKMY